MNLAPVAMTAAAAILLCLVPGPSAAQFSGLTKAFEKVREAKEKVEATTREVRRQTADDGATGGANRDSAAIPIGGVSDTGPAAIAAPPASASARVAGVHHIGEVKDTAAWNGKVYLAAGADGGILELGGGGATSRLMTRKGWKTDNFYDNGVYELASGADGLFALRGKSLFKVDANGGATLINEGWGYVKGMAVLGGKLYVIDGEDFFVNHLTPGTSSKHLASDWYNCQDLEIVGGKLVALCQDRLWLVQTDGSRRQLGARDYSTPRGIVDVDGVVHLIAETFHGYDVSANDQHEASIYRVDWNGTATKIAPLPAPWNIRETPHDVAALGTTLYLPRAAKHGVQSDREMLVVKL